MKALSLNMKRLIYGVSAAAGIAIVIVGYYLYSFTYYFHTYVGIALIAALLAPSIVLHFENRRKILIDNAWPALLDNLGEGQAVGLTMFQSLERASSSMHGPITSELKKLTAQLSFGLEFEAAFKEFSKRIGTEFSNKVSMLLLEAVRLGGDLKTSFNAMAVFVREMIELRDERNSKLRPYLMLVYISDIVFIAVIVLLYQSLFIPMSQGQTQFLNIAISYEEFTATLFDLALVEAIFGGLAAGKLSEGLMLNGLKHSVILLAISVLVFTFML